MLLHRVHLLSEYGFPNATQQVQYIKYSLSVSRILCSETIISVFCTNSIGVFCTKLHLVFVLFLCYFIDRKSDTKSNIGSAFKIETQDPQDKLPGREMFRHKPAQVLRIEKKKFGCKKCRGMDFVESGKRCRVCRKRG